MTLGTAKALWVEIRVTDSGNRMKAGMVGVEGKKGGQAKRAPRAAFPSGCLAAQTKRWA